MKILFLRAFAVILLAASLATVRTQSALASGSGACSSHDGINCSALWDTDGSVICNDGWRDSTVKYYEVDMCLSTLMCTNEELAKISKDKGLDAELERSFQIDIEYYDEWTRIRNQPITLDLMDAQLAKSKAEYYSQKATSDRYINTLKGLVNTTCQTLALTRMYEDLSKPIDYNEQCRNQYGINSFGDSSYCYCADGYEFNSLKTSCVEKAASSVNYNLQCQQEYGQFSYGNADSCYCMDGYELNSTRTTCTSKNVSVAPISSSGDINQSNDPWIQDQITKQKATDQTLLKRLSGKILLQTEGRGEAWYIDPKTNKRFYMKDGPTAYQMLRAFGLGVTESDFEKIQNSNSTLLNKLKGRIILRAQAKGEAYYINPTDLKITYLKDGNAAYQAMRLLSVGITNENLNKLPIERFVPINK